MSKKVEPKVKTFLVAEDVRQEKSNKYIVIGIFSDLIKVQEMPARIPLAFFMEFFPVPMGTLNIWLRLTLPGGDMLEIRVLANVHDNSRALVIPSPRIEVNIEQEGQLQIDVKFDDGDYSTVATVQILHDPNLNPNPFGKLADTSPDS